MSPAAAALAAVPLLLGWRGAARRAIGAERRDVLRAAATTITPGFAYAAAAAAATVIRPLPREEAPARSAAEGCPTVVPPHIRLSRHTKGIRREHLVLSPWLLLLHGCQLAL